MGIIYRHQKCEPLTIEEMDGNFENLDVRLKTIETNPPMAEGVAKIIQENDHFIVQGTFGNTLGKIVLPKIMPNAKGKWQPQTPYRMFDWVQMKHCLFSCVKGHTSSPDFYEDKDHWNLVFDLS